MSTQKSFDYLNKPKEAIPYLKPELAKTVNPKLECLTDDKETETIAEAIGKYIYENKPMYTGALIDAHRLGIGRVNIGRN